MGILTVEESGRLIEKAKSGDLRAASELLQNHYEALFAFFRRLSGSDADAADLTQKTFARAWNGLGSYAGRSSFSTWLHGIGRNLYLDWRRKGSRLEPRGEEWWQECVADGPSPFEDAAGRESATRLHALVQQLDEEKREAVHLHYYQGLSLSETAEVLGIAASTVKYRLREALDFLKARCETITK